MERDRNTPCRMSGRYSRNPPMKMGNVRMAQSTQCSEKVHPIGAYDRTGILSIPVGFKYSRNILVEQSL